MSDDKNPPRSASIHYFHTFLHSFITFFLHTKQCQILPLLCSLWSLPGSLLLDLALAERPDISGLPFTFYLEECDVEQRQLAHSYQAEIFQRNSANNSSHRRYMSKEVTL